MLGFDDISIFNIILYLNKKATGEEIIKQAQDMFANIIKVKQLEVIISCFKTDTNNPIIKNLCYCRIGYCFENDPQGSKQLAELGLLSIHMNALHPSYAINYNLDFSCFKWLLIIEFVKAFAL